MRRNKGQQSVDMVKHNLLVRFQTQPLLDLTLILSPLEFGLELIVSGFG